MKQVSENIDEDVCFCGCSDEKHVSKFHFPNFKLTSRFPNLQYLHTEYVCSMLLQKRS